MCTRRAPPFKADPAFRGSDRPSSGIKPLILCVVDVAVSEGEAEVEGAAVDGAVVEGVAELE